MSYQWPWCVSPSMLCKASISEFPDNVTDFQLWHYLIWKYWPLTWRSHDLNIPQSQVAHIQKLNSDQTPFHHMQWGNFSDIFKNGTKNMFPWQPNDFKINIELGLYSKIIILVPPTILPNFMALSQFQP